MQRDGAVVRIHPVSMIGEGPHGEVFVGMDEVLRRRVVVKRIAAGSLSHERRTQLIMEAQALCRLDHPNLLRIYNYNEEDGDDVFTFEFAAGTTLSEALEERIEFAKKVEIATAVASALAAAHRNGIVHGALSPDSVLLAENGEIKLTDFASTSTVAAGRVRAEGAAGDATPSADMYAFGLLLREMFGEGDRDVRALIASLLREAPSERATASVTLTRLQRLASRRGRRIRIAGVAVVVGFFVLGGVKYTVDLQRERSEAVAARAEAEARRVRANELVGFMIQDIRPKLGYAGRLDIMDATSEKVLAYFASMRPEQISAAEAIMNLQALDQIAHARLARGNYAGARTILGQAITLADATLQRHPDNVELRFVSATAHALLSTALEKEGDLDGAIAQARLFADLSAQLVRRYPDNPDYLRNEASGHSILGMLHDRREEMDASLRELELAVAGKRRILSLENNPENRFDLAIPIHKMSMALFKVGRFREAVTILMSERANLETLLAREKSQWRLRELVTVFDDDLVIVTMAMGDLESAARHAAAHLVTARQLTAFDAENMDWKRSLVTAHRSSGTLARMNGDVLEAIRHHAAAVDLLEGLFAGKTQPTIFIRDMTLSRAELARSLLAAGRNDAAAAEADLAVEALRPMPDETLGRKLLANALLVQGEARAAGGDPAGAASAWEEALSILGPLDVLSPDPRIADAHARVLLRLGRVDRARPLVEQLSAVGYRNRELVALYQTKGAVLNAP